MNLYAIMMVHNEMPFLDHVLEELLTFCDHVIIRDNGSTDGSREWVGAIQRPEVTSILARQASPPNHADMLNSMLLHVPVDTWVIKWDPDELPSIGMTHHLRDFLETKGSRQVGWRVPIYEMMGDRHSCMPLGAGYHQTRIFYKTADTAFEGETHEHVAGIHWGRISFDTDIAIVHFSYFSPARLKRKADHYATVRSSGFFADPERLTDRLSLPAVPLPDHITFRASDEWLETIKGVG